MPYDPSSLELLAQIIDRTRTDNGVLTDVSRPELSTDLANLSQIFSAPDETTKQHETTLWDLAEEETPTPSRRYKIFAKALAADDPLATLRTLSRDRSRSRSWSKSSTFRSESGKRTYNITARWMISGDVLK